MAVGVYVELVASLLVSAFLGLKEKVQKCGEIREREEKTGPDFKDKTLFLPFRAAHNLRCVSWNHKKTFHSTLYQLSSQYFSEIRKESLGKIEMKLLENVFTPDPSQSSNG